MKIKLKMIANYFMKHFLLKFIILSFALPIMPNVENKDWDILQKNSVWIAYTQIDFPLCKATLELDYSVSEILIGFSIQIAADPKSFGRISL